MKARFILPAFAAVLCLLSCQMEEEFIQVGNYARGNIEMTVVADMPGSKTVLSGTSVSWGSGEYLKVIETLGSAASGTAYTSAEGVVTAERIAFPVTLAAQAGSDFNYYGLYPASAWEASSNLTPAALKINLPENQTPTATSWGAGADILVSTPVTGSVSQPTSLSVGFSRLSAVGKMTLTNLGTVENVKTVTFTATGKGLAGQGVADLTAGTLTSGGDEETITLDYSGAGIAADGMTAIFTCWPVSLVAGDQFTVTVSTATKTWSKTVTLTGAQVLTFTSGSSSRFTVDMLGTLQPASGDPVTPDLGQTIFGQYLHSGVEVTYAKGTDQLSRTWSGGYLTFSIYSPAAGTSFEMSGIPENPTLSQNFTLTVSSYTGLTLDSTANYSVTVAKIDGSTVWLTTTAGDCFIVKK